MWYVYSPFLFALWIRIKNINKSMPRKKSRRKKSFMKRIRSTILKSIFLLSVWGIIAIFCLIAYYSYDLPDVSKINENVRQPSITVYDRNGTVIATIGDLYGEYVKYQAFPKNLINAVVSTEDRRFLDHSGIDILGMVRAFVVNFFAGHVVQGGSTITQQLAKNVYLSHERTIKRKIQEIALALYLEKKFTKEQILTMYLNRIYMGNGNYGVDAAAKSYFGKNISEINLYESAILAGLIKAPSRYSPANNPNLALKRASQVLENMVDNNMLQPSKLPSSGKISYKFQQSRARIGNKFPYFTDWIREQLPDYIGKYTSGDIEVRTTIDNSLQQAAEDTLENSLSSHAKEHNVSQGAMVVMSPQGDVLAIVGGKSYQESQFNRATQALRQPGSAFKLFVYLAAFQNGFKPSDIIEDAPIKINKWSPENYDGKYLGNITLLEAFAKSINTIAIKLAKEVGMAKITSLAYKLGITSEINNDLSSALGTSEVTLLELTGAYAHLANNGNAVWVHGITEIKTNGNLVYKREQSQEERIINQDATNDMNTLLREVVLNGTGKKAILPYDAAGKTGTTQNLRDVWFVGFTSDYVAGVWMGNDNNTAMDKVVGGTLPAMAWKEFMLKAEKDKNPGPIATSTSSLIPKLFFKETNHTITEPTDPQQPLANTGNNNQDDMVWDGIIKSFGEKEKPEEEKVNP